MRRINRHSPRAVKKDLQRLRCAIEPLEDRLLMAISFVANNLSFSVDALANDVFEITATPANGAPTTGNSVDLPGTGTTSFHYDGSTKRVQVSRSGSLLWDGNVYTLASFGRASTAGTEIDWTAQNGEVFFGLGERFNTLNQAGKVVDIWNEDAAGQPNGTTYFTTPVLYSSRGYALFATDNPESQFDLNSTSSGINRYKRASTSAHFYFASGANYSALIQTRASVQGKPGAVPDWAWGPWISRNIYQNQAEAEAAIGGNVQNDLPVGVIVQEAWWGGSTQYFQYTGDLGIKTVVWHVPAISQSDSDYATGVANNYFVKNTDGSVSLRDGWLAGYANIDFTNTAAVTWWQNRLKNEVHDGVMGFKVDDGEGIKPNDVFFDGRRGWQMHNDYDTLYRKAVSDVLTSKIPGQGFLWGRTASLGTDAYPGMWAGDQNSTWAGLASVVSAGLSAGISGQPFWGSDIGGFFGTPTPELYIRWAQIGALSPIMQYHGETAREPWLFGQQALQDYGVMARLRMNLSPTLITLGQQASTTGIPMMRAMALQYPSDSRFASEDTQYMLGPDLLVAPIVTQGATTRSVKFPAGATWYQAINGKSYAGGSTATVTIGLDDVPLFFRGGASIAAQLGPGSTLGQWHKGDPAATIVVGAPQLVSSSVGAQPTPAISFTFDQPMSKFVATDLTLHPTSGPDISAGSVNYNGNTVTFWLASGMAAGSWTATLRASAGVSAIGIASTNGSVVKNFVVSADAVAPAIANPAAATPLNSSTVNLSVLGSDNNGEPNLKYTWSLISAPAGGGATFAANGTNATKNTTASLTKAGAYTLRATIADAANFTTASQVTFTVNWGALTDAADVGAPALAGLLQYDSAGNTYTVTGGGTDIAGSSDQFRFASQTLAGDGTVIAQVTSLVNVDVLTSVDPSAKAGVMIRNGTVGNAAFAGVVITPSSGVIFQYRNAAGGAITNVTVAGVGAGAWVKIARSGNSLSGYYSTDGTNWTQIGSSQTIALAPTAQAGLAVTSRNAAEFATANFAAVSLLPSGWNDVNVNNPNLKGGAAYNPTSNTWITQGSGNDISGTSDQFNYAYRNWSGDGSIVVRVDAYQQVYEWTKVGIMFRNDTSAKSSAFAAMVVTPQHGVYYLSRASAGSSDSGESINAINAPVWLKLTRVGNNFNGYYSNDGAAWTQVGGTRTLSISSNAQAGLATNAHVSNSFTVVNFSNLQILPAFSIAGNVFNDANSNGAKDASELGIANWTMYLDTNNNNVKDAGETSTTTDAFGNYVFAGLSAGTYQVKQVIQSGFRKTLPGSGVAGYSVGVGTGAATGKNFGVTQNILLAGKVFNDVNSNGTQDAGEAGVANVVVQIISSNVVIATRTTDASGFWQVKGLGAGSGKAVVIIPSGYSTTNPAGGQYSGSMSAGQQNANLNFGLHKTTPSPTIAGASPTVILTARYSGVNLFDNEDDEVLI